MSARSLTRRLVSDSAGIAVSILLIQSAFVYMSFSGELRYSMLIIDSVVGFAIYFVSIYLFSFLWKQKRILPTVCGSILGSFLWIVYKLISLIMVDWSYLSNNPGDFSETHGYIAAVMLSVLTPMFSAVSIGCIYLARFATRTKSELIVYK